MSQYDRAKTSASQPGHRPHRKAPHGQQRASSLKHRRCIAMWPNCFPLFQLLSLLSPSCPVCLLLHFPCRRSSALFVLPCAFCSSPCWSLPFCHFAFFTKVDQCLTQMTRVIRNFLDPTLLPFKQELVPGNTHTDGGRQPEAGTSCLAVLLYRLCCITLVEVVQQERAPWRLEGSLQQDPRNPSVYVAR
jgi:hypothetical protein